MRDEEKIYGLIMDTAKAGYTYNTVEGKAARGFLEHTRKLPKD